MKVELNETNPNSLRCKFGWHKDDYIVHLALSLGGIDGNNTFTLKRCQRCGRQTRLKRQKVLLMSISEIPADYWEQAMKILTKE